jgi:hypothetical protein
MMLENGFADVPSGKIAAVVTHLEMLARPASRPGPSRGGVTVRHVASPEAGWYRDLFRRVGAEEWLWFSRLALDDAALAGIIRNPKVEVHSLSVQGRDEGLLELDFRIDGECELAFLGVTRQLLGTGAGRAMMSFAIEQVWSRPVRRFHVHTCTLDHPGALAFYIRSGFSPYRRQVEIADDPRLKGLLPETAAPHVPLIRQ